MAHWQLICFLAIFVGIMASTSTPVALKQELSLAKLILQRQLALQMNDAVDTSASNECFNLYLPQLQAAADEWSTNYENCYNNADNKRYNFIEQLKSDQININDSSNEICNYIKNCQSNSDALNYFKCFGELSQNVVTTIYVISNNASDDALLLTQQLEGINSDLYICTNDTQRAYVEQTAVIFDALDSCLIYGLDASLSTTTENVNELEEVTTVAVEVGPTTADGYIIDSSLTVGEDDDGTTDSTETTYFEHTTLAIMSV